MSFWAAYGSVVLGVIISVVLPLLRAYLPKPPALLDQQAQAQTQPSVYLIVGGFSILTGFLVIAVSGNAISGWTFQVALLAGYAWDSTLQKVAHG